MTATTTFDHNSDHNRSGDFNTQSFPLKMSRISHPEKPKAASIFKVPPTPAALNPIPSSSPAFGTPVHPIRPFNPTAVPAKASILPIILPPATLRPLAFRTFTKKHSLTLTSSALQVLATFIGRHCGTEWREAGLAERVLEEVAKGWKGRNGGVIVDGEGSDLKDILKNLEGSMSGGRIVPSRELSRQNSLVVGSGPKADVLSSRLGMGLSREDSQTSFGMSGMEIEDDEDDDGLKDPRKWLKVIDAFEQPRLVYNVGKKHFDRYSITIMCSQLYTNKPIETHPNRHYYLQLHIKLKYFATATT
jgi:DNA polymerase epsilon subunit 2